MFKLHFCEIYEDMFDPAISTKEIRLLRFAKTRVITQLITFKCRNKFLTQTESSTYAIRGIIVLLISYSWYLYSHQSHPLKVKLISHGKLERLIATTFGYSSANEDLKQAFV